MSIQTSQIQIGHKYKTPNNQERVVLDIINDRVIYASRGGNVKNKWKNQRTESSLDTFAKACDEDLGKINDKQFQTIKKDNNY